MAQFPPTDPRDDWPALQQFVDRLPCGSTIDFSPGASYQCATRLNVRSGLRLNLNGASIHCRLKKSPGGGAPFAFNHAFYVVPRLALDSHGNELKTTLLSDAPAGSWSVRPKVVVPTGQVRVYKEGGNTSKLGGSYVVTAQQDGSLTLDRPLSEDFTVASAIIDYPVELIHHVHIDGGGAVFDGFGDGIVEFSSVTDCVVEGIRTTGDFADPKNGGVIFACDILGRRNRFSGLLIDQRTGGYGISLETNEDSVIERCSDLGARGQTVGFWMGSCHGCVTRDCATGKDAWLSLDGSDNRVEGGSFAAPAGLWGSRNQIVGSRLIASPNALLLHQSQDLLISRCSFPSPTSIYAYPDAQRFTIERCCPPQSVTP